MKINFEIDNQLQNNLDYAHSRLYFVMYTFSLNENEKQTKIEWIRPLTPFFELASGFMIITKRVALVAENFFKGICNIVFRQKIGTGLQQILWSVPSNIFMLIPSSIKAAWVATSSLGFLFGAELRRYSFQEWLNLDHKKKSEIQEAQAKQKQAAADKKAKEDADKRAAELAVQEEQNRIAKENTERQNKENFETALAATQGEGANSPENWMNLRSFYKLGKGVSQSEDKYLECVKNAADLNHAEACWIYGEVTASKSNQITEEALKYFRMAKEAGHKVAAVRVAEHELVQLEDKLSEEAFERYLILAEDGNLGAQWMLGVMCLKGWGVEKNYEQAYDWFTKLGRNLPIEGESQFEDVKGIINWGRNAQPALCGKAKFTDKESFHPYQFKRCNRISYFVLDISRDDKYEKFYDFENVRLFIQPFGCALRAQRKPRPQLETAQQKADREARENAQAEKQREEQQTKIKAECQEKIVKLDQQNQQMQQQHREALRSIETQETILHFLTTGASAVARRR